jgi:hypothetical protein
MPQPGFGQSAENSRQRRLIHHKKERKMKKHSRPLALLLALILLTSVAACTAQELPESTTEEESASTSAPETTTVLTEEETTEEEVTTAPAPPDTDESTAPPETEPPVKKDTLRIIMQTGVGEPMLSGLAAEKFKGILDAREKALLYSHSAAIELSRTEDLVSKIKSVVLTSGTSFDLILTDPAIGGELMRSGLLEDLSGAGIAINTLPGTLAGITDSLSLGGRTYLFASAALASDITSSYGVVYNGAPLSSDPIAKAASGEFTAELMLTYIAEAKGGDAFSLGSSSPLTLYQGVGGKIFMRNDKGVPASALLDSVSFSLAYGKALRLYSAATAKTATFTVGKLSPLSAGGTWLPLPAANADAKYVTPIDASTASLFAAPAGVVSGKRLSGLVSALNSCSEDYRAAVVTDIIQNGTPKSKEMLELIISNASLDLGITLGWGNIDSLIEDAIKSQMDPNTLLSDRMTVMRNDAVDVAAKIVAERLGIN